MASSKTKKTSVFNRKKTRQGGGKFSKTPNSGGEAFLDGHRSGTPPSKFRTKKKAYRGQGK